MPQFDIQQILIRILVLTLSLSVHEYAHARMAYHLGDDTAARQGRLTINPAKHIDPIGAVAFVIAGFGWARPVPVNPVNFDRERVKTMRSGMMRVALAGPVSNLIIAFIANFIYQLVNFILIALNVQTKTGLLFFGKYCLQSYLHFIQRTFLWPCLTCCQYRHLTVRES